jgi:hypothetical protein
MQRAVEFAGIFRNEIKWAHLDSDANRMKTALVTKRAIPELAAEDALILVLFQREKERFKKPSLLWGQKHRMGKLSKHTLASVKLFKSPARYWGAIYDESKSKLNRMDD